jgi:hypothetical protein
MKKTGRNQNMTNQRLRGDETGNTASLRGEKKSQPERFRDRNLDQPAGNKQRYDDHTGTVENRPA